MNRVKTHDEFMRESFVGEGPRKELLEVMVDNLREIHRVFWSGYRDRAKLIAPFVAEINKYLRDLSEDEAAAIAEEFSRRVEEGGVLIFLRKLEQGNCGLPKSKWIYIHRQIVNILKPEPCGGACRGKGSCGGCGGDCGK